MMKKNILLLSCIASITLMRGGVAADTIVYTQNGPIPLKMLKVGDQIFSCNNTFNFEQATICSIDEIEATSIRPLLKL